MLLSTTVQQLSLCYLGGLSLSVFFRRRFKLKEHLPKIFYDGSIPLFVFIFTYCFSAKNGTAQVGIFALLCSMFYNMPDEKIKTFALCTSLYMAFAGDFSESTLASISLACATTQLIRRPNWLKEYLREIRVICGPMYVIFLSSGLRFASVYSSPSAAALIAVSALCAIVASALFRPDNYVMLKLTVPASWRPSMKHCRFIHGALMFASLVFTTARVSWMLRREMFSAFPCSRWLGMVGVMNILLYIFYKFESKFFNS